MTEKRTSSACGLILSLLLSLILLRSQAPIYALERPIPPPVSLESRIILQTSAKSTQIAFNLSRKADFTRRLVPPRGGKLGELRLFSPSWNFPKLRSLITGDRLVHSVSLQKEKKGSSIRIRLRRPVSYQVVWVEDLFQLLITLRPASEEKSPGPKHSPARTASRVASAAKGEPRKRGKVPAPPAKKREKEEEAIRVRAGEIAVSGRGKVIEARGDVEVEREGTVLKADEVRVYRDTTEVEARGRVSVENPGWRMKAGAVRLNLEKETGEIERGDIFFKQPHLSVSGKRLQKLAGQTYHIDQGVFTTCLCESGPPSWKISAEQVDLRREGEGIIRGGTFYILDIPILYLPYGFFPLRTRRKTGLLFPSFGSSSKEGFRFKQPFFWALSKSADATFNVDVETRARVGLLGEFRTVLGRDARGQINVSYFNEGLRKNENQAIADRTIAVQEIPQNRWSIVATHRSLHSAGWMTYSDIQAFSDDIFTRELFDRFDLGAAREGDIRRRRYGRSRFGVFKSWGDVHFKGEWDFYQDFIQSDARTFHRIPQLSFWGRQGLGKGPLELRWRAEGVTYLRRKGADGLRLDLRPELVAPIRLPPFLLGSLNIALRETAYHLVSDEGGFDRNNSRELVEVRAHMGTSVGRVFPWNGSLLKKIKHVVEPEISYLFIPRRKQRDIPIIDGTDRINHRNLVTFSLTNRLWGRLARESLKLPKEPGVELVNSPVAGELRELGRFKLALSYDVDKERNGGDSLSDLDLDLRLSPMDYLGLSFSGGLNPGPWQFSRAAVGLSLADPRPLTRSVLDPEFMQPSHLALGFRFIRRGFLAPLAENANLRTLPDEKLVRRNVLGQLDGSVLLHLTDHLLGTYSTTYNTLDARFTSNRVGLKVLSSCECWTVSFSVNKTTNPSKTSFNFNFNLLGLGSKNTGLTRALGLSK